MRIAGRLMANGRLPQPLAVRLEGQSAEQIAYAYVEEGGEFVFPALVLDPLQIYYVIAKIEGFKPVRHLLDISRETVFAPRIVIFLEPDVAGTDTENAKAGSVISTNQLTVKIPDKAIDEYKKAQKDSANGNYSRAIERLERALELAPDYFEAQNNLGVAHMKAGRFSDAQKALERARTLRPEADEPLINLGLLYYQEGESKGSSDEAEGIAQFRKAAELLEEAIRKNPDSAAAHQYLGATLYKTGSYDQAESMLRRALALDGQLSDAEFVLLSLLTRENRYTEALQQIDWFIKRNPKSPQRGTLEKFKGQIETALQ